jgi:hypothetical protein
MEFLLLAFVGIWILLYGFMLVLRVFAWLIGSDTYKKSIKPNGFDVVDYKKSLNAYETQRERDLAALLQERNILTNRDANGNKIE